MTNATAKIKVSYFGNCYPQNCHLVLSQRTKDGKHAYGLDCRIGFDCKEYLKGLGAKWDSADKVWYFVFATGQDAIKMIARISDQLANDAGDDRFLTELGRESVPNGAKFDEYFTANAKSVSLI
jgi:hypothetical protein